MHKNVEYEEALKKKILLKETSLWDCVSIRRWFTKDILALHIFKMVRQKENRFVLNPY